ncbi:MAG: hypothetical protein IPK44_24220 [Candidatus Accumulibacter sp.]|uniref:hypothetical protein n=1 Tax=Accumulibacter sp. TaxID=2053492 RepID=UPI00258F93BE|nr:hypothetical protein [Accumulibacter sp.]MBK8117396.1 hypothetical protein [Accumulibacter sp.]
MASGQRLELLTPEFGKQVGNADPHLGGRGTDFLTRMLARMGPPPPPPPPGGGGGGPPPRPPGGGGAPPGGGGAAPPSPPPSPPQKPLWCVMERKVASRKASADEPASTKTPDSLNLLTNPVANGDTIQFSDGEKWVAKEGWTGGPGAWTLLQGKKEHPTAAGVKGQAAFIRAIIDADEAAKAPPAWHTALPTKGLPITDDQRKSRGYELVVPAIAADAYDAITKTQMLAGGQMYGYYLPAADGRNGIARLLPDDQTPGKPWVLLNGEAIRPGMMRREQVISKLADWLRSARVVGDTSAPKAAENKPAKPATAKSDSGKPDPGRYVAPSNKDNGATSQRIMADRAGVTATLTMLNNAVRKTNPDAAYTDSEILNVATDRMDAVRDWLIASQKDAPAVAGYAGPVRMVRNAPAGRLQLFFEGKPAEEVRTDLKASGFKWAPSAGAWQRQLTENAVASAEQIIAKHFPADPAADETRYNIDTSPEQSDRSDLVANVASARKAFDKFSDLAANGDDASFEEYSNLLDDVMEAENRLVDSLAQIPDDAFGLNGKTADGRMVTLNPSAQDPGKYQLTRFDKNGEPWGDTQYPTKAQAIKEFLDSVEAASVQSFEDGARYNAATDTKSSPSDRAIYGMVAEGKTAAEILSFIGKASRRPFNRYLANALRNLGAASKLTLDSQGGWQFGNTSQAQRYAAAYNPKTDTVALFTARDAERHTLHELTHAATLKAIAAGGPASLQMRALFLHIKRNGSLDGQYGMSNLDEFVAEAFSNPKFQAALKAIPAPKGSALRNAWEWFVRLVANALGFKTAAMRTALDRAMTEGAKLMRENAALSGQMDGSDRYALAWHGTPHVWAPEPGFPHGRPRLDKMGSGEGAQAYGWGWYSADSRDGMP